MPTYSTDHNFWTYEDQEGKRVTPLYDGQAPATKYLIDGLAGRMTADQRGSVCLAIDGKDFYERRKQINANNKAVRKLARDLFLGEYKLVTYRLVRNDG